MLKKILCLIAITFVWSAFDVLAMDTVSEASKHLNTNEKPADNFSKEELNNKQLELILKTQKLNKALKNPENAPEKTV